VPLIGGPPEDQLSGQPGTILARRDGAICRATSDGAVWIPQLRRRPAPGGPGTFKLPATLALRESLDGVPEIPAPLTLPPGRRTYRQISYRESGTVGYLEFAFPGGAMSTDQCRRLLAAYRHAQTRPVKVIMLGGPRDFFANGIHLNVIQAADDPGAESWRNINAIDDLVQVILTNTGQLTVAALAGNAAAGFRAQVAALAQQLARSPDYPALLSAKARQLAAAERKCPLDAYRAAELAIMNRNFSDPHEPYARLRRAFVYKEKPSRAPLHLARHRTQPQGPEPSRPVQALEAA
jgi:hypothetical protein